jgi:hypothetical protein
MAKQLDEQIAHGDGSQQVSHRHNQKTRKEHDETEFSR